MKDKVLKFENFKLSNYNMKQSFGSAIFNFCCYLKVNSQNRNRKLLKELTSKLASNFRTETKLNSAFFVFFFTITPN